MSSYAVSLKVTKIEVIDDGNNGKGAFHKLAFPRTYADDSYFVNRVLTTGQTIEVPVFFQRSLYTKKYIQSAGDRSYWLSVERPSPGDLWPPRVAVPLSIDPSKSLGDTIWYIETHSSSKNSPNVSKIKIWFTLKTLKIAVDMARLSTGMVAFADRDCQGTSVELVGGQVQPDGYRPRGDTAGMGEFSQVTRYSVSDLRQMGNDAMSSLGVSGAEGFVWIYEHDFSDPQFASGRSRRFGPFQKWQATYINLVDGVTTTFPDRSLDNQVSAIEAAIMRRSPVH